MLNVFVVPPRAGDLKWRSVVFDSPLIDVTLAKIGPWAFTEASVATRWVGINALLGMRDRSPIGSHENIRLSAMLKEPKDNFAVANRIL